MITELAKMTRYWVLLAAAALAACGGGGGGGGSSPPPVGDGDEGGGGAAVPQALTYDPSLGGYPSLQVLANNNALTSCKTITGVLANSTIEGRLSFERVPLSGAGVSLDYGSIQVLPSRGIVVEAVSVIGGNCSDQVVASSLTDGNGDYGLAVPAGQQVCVRARAQMARTGAPAWDINVTDNTQSNAPYFLLLSNPVVAGTVASPTALGNRGALAGWDSGSGQYTANRGSGPFAILDTACEALDTVLTESPSLQLPVLNIRWSTENKEVDGELAEGEIGSPFYSLVSVSQNGSTNFFHNIFLMGDENGDTDEFDQHVVAHELGHFFSQVVARSDSVGGRHGINDLLDMSVAFEEGFADAFSGIALQNASGLSRPEFYRDTGGPQQSTGFGFGLETGFGSVAGWYSESSVLTFVYNAFDADDGVALGFAPIYDAWVDQRNTDVSVSLFSFVNSLKRQSPADASNLDVLAAGERLETVVDDLGSNEVVSNNPEVSGAADVIPIYRSLIQGVTATVCSNPQSQRQNGITVYQRLTFAATPGLYNFRVTPLDGGTSKLQVERRGALLLNLEQTVAGAPLSSSLSLGGGGLFAKGS